MAQCVCKWNWNTLNSGSFLGQIWDDQLIWMWLNQGRKWLYRFSCAENTDFEKILGFLGPYPPYSMDSPRTIQNLCRIYWARFPICGPLNPSVIDLYPHLPLKQHSYENGSLLVDLRTEWAMASSRLHRSPGWDWQSVQSAGPGIELLQNSPKFYAFFVGIIVPQNMPRTYMKIRRWRYNFPVRVSSLLLWMYINDL